MKHSVKVARNTSWLVIAMFFSRVLTAFFIILLANHLLPETFGVFNFAMAMAYVAVVTVDWGFDELTVREVSRDPSKGPVMLGNMLTIRTIFGIITIGVLGLLFVLFLKDMQTGMTLPILLLATLMIVLEKISNSFIAIFQANERMELHALTNIVWRSFFLSLGVMGIMLGFDLFKILILLLFTYVLNLIVSAVVYRIKLNGKIGKPKVSAWCPLIKKASPFMVFIVVSVIYGHIIILLLSTIRGDFETGIYSASWKIIVFFGAIPYSFGRALYPLFSKFSKSDKDVMETAYEYSLRYLLILSIPLTIGLYIVAEDILGVLYRGEYRDTIAVFKTMIWTIPFLFMNGSLKMMLWGSDKTKTSSNNLILASLVLIISGFLLIPRHGVVGAATAIVLAEMVHFFANYHSVTTFMQPLGLSLLWKPWLACGVMAAILYAPLGMIGLPLAVILYFVVLYVLKGITKKDIMVIKGVLGL